MFAQERPEYKASAEAVGKLVTELRERDVGGIVAIDGRFACGKTMLGRHLAWRCGVSLIETDLFRAPAPVKLEYRLEDIRKVLDARLRARRLIIIDGAVSQEILADLSMTPDMVIRVVALDGSDLAEQEPQILAYEARYPCTDLLVHFLPFPNEYAHGLHLTLREWTEVKRLVISEPDIRKAWIFGSRATGIRTAKATRQPPDIDLAILPAWPIGDEEGTDIKRSIEFKERHADVLANYNIHVDWHGSGKHQSDAWHLDGVLILNRD